MPALPAVCFDSCNDAYLAAQVTGKTPALCHRNSDFYKAENECSDCLASDFSLDLYQLTNALNAMFGQYVDYCRAWRKEQAALGLATTVSFLSTMSTIYVDTHTLPPGVTLTQPITPSLPMAGVFTKTLWTTTTLGDDGQLVSTPVEAVTGMGLDRKVFAKTSYISRVADLPGVSATLSPSFSITKPGSEGDSSGPSTAVIAGVSAGGALIILLVLLFFVRRRRNKKRDKLRQTILTRGYALFIL
ncbi:hypothetical protein V8F33_005235 [Rhypophila sp. PSN 637]